MKAIESLRDPLISLAVFAAELGVCVKTIYRRIDEKELPPPVKIGRCSRYPRSVLDAYRRKIGAGPSPLS